MDYGDESYEFDGTMVMGEEDNEEIVTGAPIDQDALEQFLARDRSIRATMHPMLSEGIAWISSDRIPKKKDEVLSSMPVEPAEVQLYQIFHAYGGVFERKRTLLALDFAEIFEDLQATYNDDQDADVSSLVAETSKRYRTKLDDVRNDLAVEANSTGLCTTDEQWQATLNDTMSIWLCAEAIYMTPQGTLLADGLMQWVNKLSERPTQEEGKEVMNTKLAYLHPAFWDYICKGLIRGLFEMVGNCLEGSGLKDLHQASSRAVGDLCLLLRTCPRGTSYVNRLSEFRDRYRLWRAKVAKASKELAIENPEIAAGFRQVYELLKGQKDAIYRQCDTWQECLAALALLFDPVGIKEPVDVRMLFELVTESEDAGLPVDRTLPSEEACAALCAGNIPKAIIKAEAVDLSVAAHLADMLEKLNVLGDAQSNDLNLTVRDMLVMGMGERTIAQRGAWKAAFTYWRSAGDAGIDSIQSIINRIPTSSQAETDELLTICFDLDLHDEAAQIESIWARKLEQAGHHNRAVVAYDRADNPLQIDHLNWRLFEDSLLIGHAISKDEELREALQSPEATSSTSICALMAPYATLAMMYQLKQTNDIGQAALHLSSLLIQPDMPRQYVPLLMAEMLPLLEVSHTAFSLRDIFDSLAAIEEYYDSKQYQAGLSLLSTAMKNSPTNSSIPDWRQCISPKFSNEEVLALVRLKIARTIGTKFIQG